VIDAGKLHAQLDATVHKLPWCVYPPGDPWGKGIGAAATKYTIGSFEFDEDDRLAVAAVNALPALLAVYEAAIAWREDRAQVAGALLWRDRDAADRLIATIDAARSAL